MKGSYEHDVRPSACRPNARRRAVQAPICLSVRHRQRSGEIGQDRGLAFERISFRTRCIQPRAHVLNAKEASETPKVVRMAWCCPCMWVFTVFNDVVVEVSHCRVDGIKTINCAANKKMGRESRTLRLQCGEVRKLITQGLLAHFPQDPEDARGYAVWGVWQGLLHMHESHQHQVELVRREMHPNLARIGRLQKRSVQALEALGRMITMVNKTAALPTDQLAGLAGAV